MLEAIKFKHEIENKSPWKNYKKDFKKAFRNRESTTEQEKWDQKDFKIDSQNFGASKLNREDFFLFKMHQGILKELPEDKDVHLSSLVDIKSYNEFSNPGIIGFDASQRDISKTGTYIQEYDILGDKIITKKKKHNKISQILGTRVDSGEVKDTPL